MNPPPASSLLHHPRGDKGAAGLSATDRTRISEGLAKVMADTYTLYLRTHAYHWNVTGPHFPELHDLFEKEYNALWLAVDDIAERIRSLGAVAPATSSQIARLATVEEDPDGSLPDWQAMVEGLAIGHETAASTARELVPIASAANDEATGEILTARLAEHEKSAWMLRSILE